MAASAPGRIDPPLPRLVPLSPQRYTLLLTIDQETHDDLRRAQELLGHQAPSGDIAAVFGRALKALIGQLEKTKFAATKRPHRSPRPTTNPRHIPAEVKRAVWERDQGRCTFVSDTGRRCPARTRLEFDHAEPVARGGRATVAGIRLRCRAHNQYGAERTFGVEFIQRKREETPCAAEARRRQTAARAQAEAAQGPSAAPDGRARRDEPGSRTVSANRSASN